MHLLAHSIFADSHMLLEWCTKNTTSLIVTIVFDQLSDIRYLWCHQMKLLQNNSQLKIKEWIMCWLTHSAGSPAGNELTVSSFSTTHIQYRPTAHITWKCIERKTVYLRHLIPYTYAHIAWNYIYAALYQVKLHTRWENKNVLWVTPLLIPYNITHNTGTYYMYM